MKKSLIVLSFLLATVLNISAKNQPNIIWIMAEDMSIDLECYGMKAVKTPNLNKLAEQGVRFDECFVTNPICSPSRSAMMVGTHQVRINAGNHRSNRNVPLDEQFKPFTYHLRKAGYTCILGHHSVMKNGRKIDCNFKTEALGEWDGKSKFGLFDKYDNFEAQDQPFYAHIQLVVTHRGDWWNEIREKSAHPVNPNDVELPDYLADHPVIRLDWAKYLDQVEYMDGEVGMIVKELEDKGLADNTIIVFIGDNGRCNIKGKGYLNDPGLHIPFIAYNPKGLPGKKVRKDVVSATDITATVLDWAGVEVPDYMTGMPVFDKKFKREYSYGARDLWDEVEEKMRSITDGEWKYIRNDKTDLAWDAHQAYLEFYRPAVHIMRELNKEGKLTKTQQFFFNSTKPKEELYNLKNDPQELVNLANNPEYAKQLSKMRKATEEFDSEYVPVNNIYEPIAPVSVDVLEWLKTEKPDAYEQMLAGVEIGFKKYTTEYKKAMKAKKKK
ncbi:sulfatase family protein [Saccharicrinis aurantiacus]|uniref:sulfatase family protein n=1 Tax=Saccharicrinis aurantiacus TaxID=1849719 RepID=UPI0024915436|nr:sulfatase [Saccharicrinis aurantiacus]